MLKYVEPRGNKMKKGIVLKASAGTGKTYRLALEYIKLLIEGSEVEEILVTTFTKKATFEIKERIINSLSALARGDRNLLKSLGDIGARSLSSHEFKNIYENIIFNKHRLRIYTIDSFINNAFNKFVVPYFNLHGYTLVRAESNYENIESVWETIVQNEDYFQDFKKFFDNFLEKDVTSYIKWIKELIDNRWKFIFADFRTKEKLYPESVDEKFSELLFNLKKVIDMKKGAEGYQIYLKEEFKDIFVPGEAKLLRSKYIDRFLALEEKGAFWNGARIRKNKANERKYSELLRSHSEFKKALGNYVYNNKILPLEAQLIKIASIVFDEYDKLKGIKKELTHNDILTYTYRFITLPKNRVELVEKNVNKILIDEFQDTSILQWSIIKSLIKRDSSYIFVGDEKQAIYGWRGGEKELLVNLPNILESKEENLNISYRSHKEIVAFTNRFFGHLGILSEDVRYLKEKKGGYVNVSVGDRRGNKEQIVRTIFFNKIPLKRTAIIARTNSDLEEVAIYLKNYGIPYIKESSLGIVHHRAIKPVHHLLKFFVSFNFIHLLKFLRHEIINIDSTMLREVTIKKSEITSFFKGSGEEPILKDEVKNILKLIKEINGLTLKEQIREIFKKFGILKRYDSLQDAKNIQTFLYESENFDSSFDFLNFIEGRTTGEIYKQVGIDEVEAVKLLTVHRSKGLEFKTVFFAWHFSYRVNMGGEKLLLHLEMDKGYSKSKNYCFTATSLGKALKYLDGETKYEKEDKEVSEEINTLYVGLTRASENLYFFASFDRSVSSMEVLNKPLYGKADEFYWQMKRALLFATGAHSFQSLYRRGYEAGIFNDKDKNEIFRPRRAELDFLKDHLNFTVSNGDKVERKDASEEKLTLKSFNKSVKGTVAHFYLSYFTNDFQSKKDIALNGTLNKFENIVGRANIYSLIEKVDRYIYESKILDMDEGTTVLNEYAILHNGEEYRIDRVHIDEKNRKIEIFDYKTGELVNEEEVKNQLKRYKEAFLSLTKGQYAIEAKYIKVEM